jgi:hypothetical protein
MATVRQVRTSLVLFLWFILSALRAWPSRVFNPRPTNGTNVQQGLMFHIPLSRKNVGYGLEVRLNPAGARLVRLSDAPLIASLSPGAFVSRMPRMQQSQAQPVVRTSTCLHRRCTTTRTRTTRCTTAPPPVPPPVTTVRGQTGQPQGCSRTTINTVCDRIIGQPYHCKVEACCWTGNVRGACDILSTYTTGGTYTTYTFTSTTFTTCSGLGFERIC